MSPIAPPQTGFAAGPAAASATSDGPPRADLVPGDAGAPGTKDEGELRTPRRPTIETYKAHSPRTARHGMPTTQSKQSLGSATTGSTSMRSPVRGCGGGWAGRRVRAASCGFARPRQRTRSAVAWPVFVHSSTKCAFAAAALQALSADAVIGGYKPPASLARLPAAQVRTQGATLRTMGPRPVAVRAGLIR